MGLKGFEGQAFHVKRTAFVKPSLIILMLLMQIFAFGQTNIRDSLRNLLNTKLIDSSRVIVLNQLANQYLFSKPDSSLLLAQKGLTISREIKYAEGEANCLNIKGIVYWITGNYPDALQNFLQSLEIREQIHDGLGMALAYMNMGIIYSEQKEYAEAISYTQQAKILSQEIGDTLHFIYTLVNLGDYFEKTNQLDSAREYTQRAYDLALKSNDMVITGAALTNLGNIHCKMNQPALALEYYRLGLPDLIAAGNDEGICEATLGIAQLFKGSGNRDSALYYSRWSLETAKAGGFTKRVLNASLFLTDYFKSINNMDSAFAYQAITVAGKDSLFSQEKVREVQNLSFAEELRQQEIAEAHEQAMEVRESNLQMAAMGAFIPFFFGLILLLGKRKVKPKIIEFMGLFGLLMLFEFVSLFLHPYIESLTHHTPVYMLLILIGIAAIILPLHHKLEHLVKERLVHGRYLNFSAAEKDEIIASLEEEPSERPAETEVS